MTSFQELNAETSNILTEKSSLRKVWREKCTNISKEVLTLEEKNVERKKRLNRAEFDVELCRGEERHIRQTFDEKQVFFYFMTSFLLIFRQ